MTSIDICSLPRTGSATSYRVTTVDGHVRSICADAYMLEGPLTTFLDTDGRGVVDSWSTRILSVRTSDVAMIERIDGTGELVADIAGVA